MMGEILWAWRGELAGVLAWAGTWWVFARIWRRPFWRFWFPGMLLGLANEVSTEPEWTYTLQWYVWRDVSPIVIAGWGVMFCWLVALSNLLERALFGAAPISGDGRRWRRLLTDVLVGVPLLLGNELFGLYILRVWKYNTLLHWDTFIPGLNYPWAGLAALFFFVLALPAAVRYWEEGSSA